MPLIISRWDYAYEGFECPICNGKSLVQEGNMRVPCYNSYFKGHGYPTCVKGRLHFSEYDRLNEAKLKELYPNG